MNLTQTLLRDLPAIDKILNHPQLVALGKECPHTVLKESAQATIEDLRQAILRNPEAIDRNALALDHIASASVRDALVRMSPSLRHVINATGTLLHTNLGRAPLSEPALEAIHSVARTYSNLELDLGTGKRGYRFSHVEELLCRLTGAQAAAVVNNNAGAVYLALTAIAHGKDGIVSRGELVEIGGAFRVPEVMAASGVNLVEVGATNKTHLRDYRNALTPETGLLLKVHTSNFRIVGFTSQVSGAELAELGREQGIPVMEDLGSGMLFDLSEYGLPREPTVAEAVAAGIDIVTFSGDKLLGGPQAGIIVGRRSMIEKIRSHPMARALRMDKLTLASLEATLRLYLDEKRAMREIPVLHMLSLPADELDKRCRELAEAAQNRIGHLVEITVIPAPSTVGGGALPVTELAGFALTLTPRNISTDQLATRLRRQNPPVIGRVQDDRLLLNLRTVRPHEEELLLQSLEKAVTVPYESD